MYSGNDLKKDTLIVVENIPYRVVESAHHAMGRGGGVVRTKLKNLISGAVLERTFRPTDKIEPADIERAPMQYLYAEGDAMMFMNTDNYEQETVAKNVLGDQANYIAEGTNINLLKFKSKIIGLEMPNSVFLKVTHTEPGIKGDTATGSLKPCTIETDVQVMVPLFINEGDVIKVDSRTGAYLERQK
jgi:elongation factor P